MHMRPFFVSVVTMNLEPELTVEIACVLNATGIVEIALCDGSSLLSRKWRRLSS